MYELLKTGSDPQVGVTYSRGPIPFRRDVTQLIDAGPLTIGVGRRVVEVEEVLAFIDEDELARTLVSENLTWDEWIAKQRAIPMRGVALHVLESAGNREYLRFDCFEDNPHYHYITEPDVRQTVVRYDSAAGGPMLGWALDAIGHRLTALLAQVGRSDLARQAQVDARFATGLVRATGLAHEIYNSFNAAASVH